jgi:ligand-binding sensor domain-containing protein
MMKFLYFAIIILIGSIFSPYQSVQSAPNNDFKFDSITTKQGLSQNNVNAIIQDHYGYIWIGTSIGLNRYDGITFEIYKNDPDIPGSISSSSINCVYETKDGRLWVGTTSGLNLFQRETGKFVVYKNASGISTTISSDFINCIYQDSRGTLFIGTNK